MRMIAGKLHTGGLLLYQRALTQSRVTVRLFGIYQHYKKCWNLYYTYR